MKEEIKKYIFHLLLFVILSGFLVVISSHLAYKRGISDGRKIGFVEGKEEAVNSFIMLTK